MNKVPPPPIFGQTFLLFWDGTAAQQQQQSLGLGLGPRADLQQGEGDPPQKSPPEAGTKNRGGGGGQTESKGRVFCVHAIFSPRHILSYFLGRGIIFLDYEKV